VDLEAHAALAFTPCRGSAVCSPSVGEDGEARPGVHRLRLCRVLVFYQGGRAECLWLPTELCSPFYPSAQGQSPVASRCPMPLSRPLWPGHPGERRPTVAGATAVNSPTGQPPASISSAPRFDVQKQPVSFFSRTFFFVINHAMYALSGSRPPDLDRTAGGSLQAPLCLRPGLPKNKKRTKEIIEEL